MKKITSRNNIYIKLFNSLFFKHHRDSKNLFIILGEKSINIFLKKFEIKYLYSNSMKLLNKWNIDLSKKILVNKSLINIPNNLYVDNFIGAIFEKNNKNNNLKIKNTILLNSCQNPYNLGIILRTANALGYDNIILDKGCCDIYNLKCISSIKNCDVFGYINIMTNEDIDKYIKNNNFCVVICDNPLDKKNIFNKNVYDEKLNYLIIFGNEGHGIDDYYKKIANYYYWIKIKENSNSLNLASAASIVMFDLKKLFLH